MSSPQLYPFTVHFPADAQPPVRVAGEFTTPPWSLVNLEPRADDDGHMTYSKTMQIPEGRWQYKFCVGEDNVWVCKDSAPKGSQALPRGFATTTSDIGIVVDDDGNENNVLIQGGLCVRPI